MTLITAARETNAGIPSVDMSGAANTVIINAAPLITYRYPARRCVRFQMSAFCIVQDRRKPMTEFCRHLGR